MHPAFDSEGLLVLYLTSTCSLRESPQRMITTLFLLIICLAWLGMAMLYWSYPGGHAWGRFYFKKTKLRDEQMIPGPRGVPFVGSMSLMSSNLAHHRLLAAAESLEAKRLMAFSLGETRVIVTCHPDVAKEILSSSVFADRPIKDSAYSLMFNRAIGFAPFGVYWRTLRKIAATHLFCPKQISASEAHRTVISNQMVHSLINIANQGCTTEFEVRDMLKRASLNNMMCLVFGRSSSSLNINHESDDDELGKLVQEGYELLGQLNWADHLPWLATFDLQKIRHRCSLLVPKVNTFLARIISQHRAQPFTQRNRDFLDVLLSLKPPNKLSDPDIIAVLWEMIFRGTDTIAVLMEWILARLVLHPKIQAKLHQELDDVVGRTRAVKERDIASMVYLQALVKEVLRLHPPGPLLSWARLAICDTVVDGHNVPAGTTAMVNMWAISRDPKLWPDPMEFNPERFINIGNSELDFSVMGSDLRLAPFGSGRRTCPGKALGLTTVGFWVASLVHEFEWAPSDYRPVNLSEVLKLSCEMAYPLTVKALPRRASV